MSRQTVANGTVCSLSQCLTGCLTGEDGVCCRGRALLREGGAGFLSPSSPSRAGSTPPHSKHAQDAGPAICRSAAGPRSGGSHGRAQPVLPDRSEQEVRLLSRVVLGPMLTPAP